MTASLSFAPQGYLQLPSETPSARIFNNIGFVAGYLVVAFVAFRKNSRLLPLSTPLLASTGIIVSQVFFDLQNFASLSLPPAVTSTLHAITGIAFSVFFSFWASTAYITDGKNFRFLVLAGSLISSFVVIFVSATESFFAASAAKYIAIALSLILLFYFAKLTSHLPLIGTNNANTTSHSGAALLNNSSHWRKIKDLFLPVMATGILGFVYQYAWTIVAVNSLASLAFAVGEAFAVALIFLLSSMPNDNTFSVAKIFRTLCPIACLAVIPLFFTSGILQLLFMGIDSAIFNLFIILLMPLCAAIGKRSSFSIAGLYALSASIANLFPTLGFAVGMTPIARDSAALYITVIVLMAGLSIFAFIAGKRVDSSIFTGIPDGIKTDKNSASSASPHRTQIAASLSEEYGLTKREREILELILLGRNAPFIAEELVISTNTVKTHIKRIYRKLGIHSRQDLADLTEELEKP